LSASFDLMRRGFVPLMLISALQVFGLVIYTALAFRYADTLEALVTWAQEGRFARIRGEPVSIPAVPDDLWPVLILGGVLSTFVTILAFFGQLVVADALYRGRPVSATVALIAGFDRLPTLIGVVLIAVVALVPLVLSVFVAGVLGGLGIVLWALVVLVGGGYVWLRVLPILSVVAVEEEGPLGSIGRSWGLTRGNLLITFAVSLFAFLLSTIGGFIVGFALGIVAVVAGNAVIDVGSFVWTLIALSWTAVTSVVLLDELRRRNDPQAATALLPVPQPSTAPPPA
jgi:hypothetical protein